MENKPHTSALGERIRAARLAHGISQAQLARLIGITSNAMNMIENGTTPDPRVSRIVAIVQQLGVTYEALLGSIKPTRPATMTLPPHPLKPQGGSAPLPGAPYTDPCGQLDDTTPWRCSTGGARDVMKVREVLQRLRADGWYQVKSGGSSHRQLKHPLKPGRVTVAGNDNADIPPKTLASIWRQAQMED